MLICFPSKVVFVRDDYLGNKSFQYSLKVYKWSKAGAPVHEINGDAITQSFSVTKLIETNVTDLLKKSECKDTKECVVRVEVSNEDMEVNVENFYLLEYPKHSNIAKPNLKVVSVKKRSDKVDNRYVFDISLSASAVAPFVVLDFKHLSPISGQFPTNGFFVFDTNKNITFESESDWTERQISDDLVIKTLNDIK